MFASLQTQFWQTREALAPVVKDSNFKETGRISPEQFVHCGDYLVYKFPTWSWEAGEPSKRRDFLPADKQYLIQRNVPCLRRVSQLADGQEGETFLSFADNETNDWVATHTSGSAPLGSSSSKRTAPDMGDIPDADVDGLAGAVGATSLGGSHTGKPDEDQMPNMDDIPDMDDDEEGAMASGGVVEEEDEAALPPTAAASAPSDNLVQVRTYDCFITYDKYYQTPRMWLLGYDEHKSTLPPASALEDVSADHAQKTVTIEPFPHSSLSLASVHPCKHSSVMKKFIERMDKSVIEGHKKKSGGMLSKLSSKKTDKSKKDEAAPGADEPEGLRVDQYLVVFLKFMSSIVPTIEIDATNAIALLCLAALSFLRLAIVPHLSNASGAPLSTCGICSASDDLCDKWGSSVLKRSRAYGGTGYDFDRFLSKVRQGRHVKVGIIGGSISACIDSAEEDCYVRRLERQLRKDFQGYGAKVDIVNGAISAVGSDFFSACWKSQFLEEMDLYILELAVNDVGEGKENRNMDVLMRSIFTQPTRPSILLLDMWSPLQPWSNGAPSIESLAQYYDLPAISHRAVTFHQRRLHNTSDEIHRWFHPGAEGYWQGWGHHPSALGHELTADLLVSYIRERMCERAVVDVPGRMNLTLPHAFSEWTPYQELNEDPHPSLATSTCYGPQRGALHFPITSSPSPEFIQAPFVNGAWKDKHFLVGKKPGDRVEFDIQVTKDVVGILYWRSATLGLGRAWIWLEGEEERRIPLWGDWGSSANQGNVPVRHDLPTSWEPGPRKLIVEIMADSRDEGEHEFRISTIIV